jgi:hypothetical protein
MGFLSSFFLLVVVLASIPGHICSCEIKNATDNCVVEGEKTAGKS